MSEVEAAASLFGSSDSGSDFFSVSDGGTVAASGSTSSGNDFYSSSSQAASELFAPDEVENSGDASLFDARGEATHAGGSHVHPLSGQSTHGEPRYEEHHAQYASFPTETNLPLPAQGQAVNHVYDQGSWQSEGIGQQASNSEYYDTANSYDYTGDTMSHHPYDPAYSSGAQYQSTAHSDYPTHATSSTFVPNSSAYLNSQSHINLPSASPSTLSTSSSVYDPYKPTTPATNIQSLSSTYNAGTPSRSSFTQVSSDLTTSYSNGYDQPMRPVSSSAYDPYKSSVADSTSLRRPTENLQEVLKSNSLGTPSLETAKASPPVRPSVSNAYDPPMPQRKKPKSGFATGQSPMPAQYSPFAAPSNLYTASHSAQNESRPSPGYPPPPPAASARSSPYHYSSHGPASEQYTRSPSPVKNTTARAVLPPPPREDYRPGSPQKAHASLTSPSYGTGGELPLQGPAINQHEYQGSQHNTTLWNGNAMNDILPHRKDASAPETNTSHNKSPPLASRSYHPSSPSRRAPSFDAARGVTPPVGLPRTSSPLQHLAYSRNDEIRDKGNYLDYSSQVQGGRVQEPYGEPYGHVPRPSFDERAKSPTGGSIHSLGSGGIGRESKSAGYARNVDLTESDTSSVYNVTSSPPVQHMQPLAPNQNLTMEEIGTNVNSYHLNSTSRSSSPQVFGRPATDPYAPVRYPLPSSESTDASPSRMRAMSNTSTFSQSSAHEPYAPSRSNTIYEEQSISQQIYSPPSSYTVPPQLASGRSSLEKARSPPPVMGPYAPSPSLSGTNDPLGRTRARIPVVQFGFGGKLITCFHSSPLQESSYDYSTTTNRSTDITIRLLHKLLPESAVSASSVVFPGPLFGDAGSSVTALAITSTSGSAKVKKAKVLSYLDERAKELEQGMSYHGAGTPERRSTEGKFVLVRLLHAMVENDGNITGSVAAVAAARKALLPMMSSTENSDGSTGAMAISTSDLGSAAYPSFATSLASEQPIAEYVVRASTLERIQSFILRGELRQAYHFALDEKLWAHAMVIAHGLDKDAFKEVAEEFIKTELGTRGVRVPGSALPVKTEGPVTNGRESLRLAYGLYSGQAATAVQQLLPSKLSNGSTTTTLTVQPPTPLHMTPMSPSFPPVSGVAGVPAEMLAKWQEYAAALLSGQAGSDQSIALTTLGDYLVSNDWVEAGHCCYLLSPQTSPYGGVGTPAARIVLLGSQHPTKNTAFYRDSDSFTFSEIVEYAISLRATAKGQEAFAGFPHLQAYRLVRALQLADLGHMSEAKRYCDAILTCTTRSSPYLTSCFLEQLADFSRRLHGNIELDKNRSWGKISKPSLDTIGGWLGGTLSKFVAGEAEPSSPLSREGSIAESAAYSGAFQHYSAISSANPSRVPSPAPSLSNTAVLPPQLKTNPSYKSLYNSQTPISRSSSAIDHMRPGSRKNTPPPRVASANPMTTTFAQSRSFSNASISHEDSTSFSSTSGSQGGGWWSAAYGEQGGPTPTAASFDHYGAQTTASTNGFISPVDSYQSSTSSATTPISQHMGDEEFEDELGLGNSSNKSKKPFASDQNQSSSEHQVKSEDKPEQPKTEEDAPKKPELRSAPSSSWLGRLWSRGSTPTVPASGPKKANLGEQSSFYYDKDLKRWVNKKAGAEETKAEVLPPPPSRSQTTAPLHAPAMSSTPSFSAPPPRPMSAMEPGMPPPSKSLPRIRSNLNPDASSESPPLTPAVMSGITGAPPTGRSKSAAGPARRGARNRYVDVFENENA